MYSPPLICLLYIVLCLFIHHLSYVMYVISAKEEIKSIYIYIYTFASPRHPSYANWIKVRRFGWPRHEFAKGSKSCMRYKKSQHLASGL